VYYYTGVKRKISIVLAGIVVTLALLLASSFIVRNYHQVAYGGGHRGHRGYHAHSDYYGSGPLNWHPNGPIFCNSGTPSICHPSIPTVGDLGTSTMGNPGNQDEGNIGQPPGNPGDNGYPGDNEYSGGPIY
jgi:hypothetical protein